jgi:outer membrane lipoprotein SlyB
MFRWTFYSCSAGTLSLGVGCDLNYMGEGIRLAALCLVLVSFPACETYPGGDSYPRSMRGQAMEVNRVQVLSVRPVVLRGDSSLVGVGAGALAGGLAGSMIGHGKASGLAAVGGALAGGLVGSAAERKITTRNGVEIVVRMQSGREYMVVQPDRGEGFRPGEWVRLMSGGERSIISR